MCLRPAPIDNRTAISVERPAARPSRRFATLAQQIRRTMAVTLNRIVNDWRVSPGTVLCPRYPGSSCICLARNSAILDSDIFCSGASTSVMIGRYWAFSAACACSRDTPGLSRANR